ncbi:MAG TPA: HAD-IC family P-type ATPase, partial [Alphaproteobacteria bacterium]|nr:HAD-IC family P-type ATPase [Alphaproteobacteria bacterium]
TGSRTEIGKIAVQIARRPETRPPLMIRMERLTRNIAIAVGVAVVFLVMAGSLRGMDLRDLFMMSVGLAVSAIPEGLPVAISIALAIGMRRMARVNVIVRTMPAVEALGSCTMIATDKTGTLTLNELTVTDILLPDGAAFVCETGQDLAACRILEAGSKRAATDARLAALLRAAALPNEGVLRQEPQGQWLGSGDTVDVALLTAAHKGGVRGEALLAARPLVARIPYESDLKYAASFHQAQEHEGVAIFVKGAPDALIAMCESMDVGGTCVPMDRRVLEAQKESLTTQGLRVLAFAQGQVLETPQDPESYGHRHLVNLTFLGMVGMRDPVRPEVPQAIRDCRSAGVEIAMVTGDDPATAAVIARHAGLEVRDDQIVTGDKVREAQSRGDPALDALTRHARIYARVEPTQKLSIVRSMARNGHFVAVTGDGVNDAPALRHAHVGVAMGRKGTDVARESAGIILTDDNFASIVAGIREGRVSYANIRKVIFMSLSTGAAEVVVFILAMIAGTPMPLFAVQLLWLNLVTNGIQDVALVCEKAEGDELSRPPRRPGEPVFDRLMRRRIVLSTLVMGVGGFAVFTGLLEAGYDADRARNLLLLLFVLFENFQCLNARSERHSLFR